MNKKKKKIEELNREDLKNHFKVAIFGSARLKPGDKGYDDTFKLAKELAKCEFDVITGGGPGVMEAANKGHSAGDPDKTTDSIGIVIQLPWENEGNAFLEKEKHFKKFSGRLDQFVNLSNAIVIMPGGIGTALELFYFWQLTQVKHICKIPIIVYGKQWEKLLDWVKENQVKAGLVSPEDLTNVVVAKSIEEIVDMLKKTNQHYLNTGLSYDLNYHKYNSGEKIDCGCEIDLSDD